MSYTVISVVGARPNFIKVAPIHRALKEYPDIDHLICHTGQHFDSQMSDVFFRELALPVPQYNLGVSGGSHAQQTARIMMAFEEVVFETEPDLVLVVGDVNSTLACSLVACKLGIKVAHVEAGLRSFDRSMPEEINRMVTDAIADYLFVTEESGTTNLIKEGKKESDIFFTGNVMIDSLVRLQPKFEKSEIVNELKLEAGNFVLCTFHRPNNVDSQSYMRGLMDVLNEISEQCAVVFPIHPRTRHNLETWEMLDDFSARIILSEPIGYIDFLALTSRAKLLITDSGGIQEETTYLGVQCITVRDNTERPVTIELGTNQLIGRDTNNVKKAAIDILGGKVKEGKIPPLWDGHSAERIAKIIVEKIRVLR